MISFLKKNNILENSYLYCTFGMAFFLPLSIKISNLFLILFFIGASTTIFIRKKNHPSKNPKKLLYTLIPLFFLYTIGLLYSDPAFYGSSKIGKSISFLLCPAILFFLNKESLEKIKVNLFKGIIVGCIISFIILLINTFYNYYATRPFLLLDDEILNYHHTYYSFTEPVAIHPTYLGTYALLAIVILITHLKLVQKKMQILSLISLVILSLGILFLNSRVVFFLYAFLGIVTFLKMLTYYYTKRKFLIFFILIGAVSYGGVSVQSILSDTYISTRLTKELSWELSNQKHSNYNSKIKADSRITRWRSAIKVIKEKPMLGYGTKMEKTVLNRQFIEDGLVSSAKNNYDSHNMYLSTSIEYGLVGLAIFIAYLFYNILFSFRKKNAVAFFFFASLSVVCFFENYLANNAGITFVAFFGSVSFFLNQKKV